MAHRFNKRLFVAIALLIGLLPSSLNWLYLAALSAYRPAFWILDACRFVLIPALLVTGLVRARLVTISELGFHARIRGSSNGWLFLTAIVAIPIVLCIADSHLRAFTNSLPSGQTNPNHFQYTQVLPPPGPATGLSRLAVSFYLALTAGVVEELYYRGLFRLLFTRGRIGSIGFVVCSSACFASIHAYGGEAKAIYAFLWGASAALCYLASDNLYPVILAHILIDLRAFN